MQKSAEACASHTTGITNMPSAGTGPSVTNSEWPDQTPNSSCTPRASTRRISSTRAPASGSFARGTDTLRPSHASSDVFSTVTPTRARQ